MNKKVTWISHRGLGDVENTQVAFDRAVDQGFKFLETDLRITKDGHLVLCHDISYVRLGGSDQPVQQMLRADIQKMSLGQRGEKPLFFDEFIDRYAGLSWTLDIKPECGFETIQALKIWAELHQATEWLQTQAKFLFWDGRQQALFKTFFPNAHCYAQKIECWHTAARNKARMLFLGGVEKGQTYSAPVYMGQWQILDKAFVDRIHRYGGRVLAFLPKTDHEVQLVLDAGVDEILTNGEILNL